MAFPGGSTRLFDSASYSERILSPQRLPVSPRAQLFINESLTLFRRHQTGNDSVTIKTGHSILRGGHPAPYADRMGRKRRAWLHGGNGIRIENGKRLPGYYACWREFRPGRRPVMHRRKFEKSAFARDFVRRHNAKSDLLLLDSVLPMTLNEASREFIESKRRKALSTRQQYDYTLIALAAIVGSDIEVSRITAADVDKFLTLKARRGLSAASLNKHARNLHAFFAWAVRKQYVAVNPVLEAETAERKSVAGLKPTITDAMVAKILKALEYSEDRQIGVLIAATTGMDRTEIEQLTRDTIDFDEQVIRGLRVKTGKPYTKPLNAALIDRLRPIVSRATSGKRLLPDLLPRRRRIEKLDWWAAACEAAGVSGVLFRHLRAYAAHWLMKAPGMTLRRAQELLGHSSIVTTATNYDLPDPEVRQAVQSLPLPGSAAKGKRRSKGG